MSEECKKFEISQKVVYPSHGVGKITSIEMQSLDENTKLEVYVISFPREKMLLRVPVDRALDVGLRTIMSTDSVGTVYDILAGNPQRGNKMWSRRAQEYEAKINSGEINAIAEVVRDLYKDIDENRSYGERMIYGNALSRLVSEIAILESVSEEIATERIIDVLKEKFAAV